MRAVTGPAGSASAAEAAGALAEDPPATDVLVIGAGIVGLCCAHYLRDRGLTVTVVDRGAVGDPEAASSGNTGFVAHGSGPLGGKHPLLSGLRSSLRPDGHLAIPMWPDRDARAWLSGYRRADDTSAALVALKSLSLNLLGDLSDGGPTVTRSGLVVAFRSDGGFRAAARAVPIAAERGVPVRVLSRDELASMEPGVELAIAGALYQDGAAFLHLPDFLNDLAGRLTARGVTIMTGTEVTALSATGSRVTAVQTNRGELRPTEVVIAAGAWAPALGRMLAIDIPVYPVKGYAITMPSPGGAPRGPMFLREGTVAVRPLGDRIRFAGSLVMSGRPGISRRRIRAMLATVRAHLPAMRIAPEPHVWSGLRPSSPDSLPLIGRPAGFTNVSLACGHGHVGMGLAPGTGLLVAQSIAGEPSALDLAPFAADRFGLRRSR